MPSNHGEPQAPSAATGLAVAIIIRSVSRAGDILLLSQLSMAFHVS